MVSNLSNGICLYIEAWRLNRFGTIQALQKAALYSSQWQISECSKHEAGILFKNQYSPVMVFRWQYQCVLCGVLRTMWWKFPSASSLPWRNSIQNTLVNEKCNDEKSRAEAGFWLPMLVGTESPVCSSAWSYSRSAQVSERGVLFRCPGHSP